MSKERMMCSILAVLFMLLLQDRPSEGFLLNAKKSRTLSREYRTTSSSIQILAQRDRSGNSDDKEKDALDATCWRGAKEGMSRRSAIQWSVAGSASIGLAALAPAVAAIESDSGYIPATRPTAYRVDSTQPPTLIPLTNARKETKVLTELGKGLGTDKKAIVDDSVNLNNMLNKAVFGSIDAVSSIAGSKKDESKFGSGYASFLCMGLPAATTAQDIDLAISLLGTIVQSRSKDTALGLAFCPMSVQSALDVYSQVGDEPALKASIKESGVDDTTIDLYMPLLQFCRLHSLQLLALSPELKDIVTARTKGLQSINPERREEYVVDPQGFISLTQDPRYKLYTDRSLLKDFEPAIPDEKASGFFAERILVHETGATVAAKYAVDRPESLVAMVAPMPDVRFLLGINGRIPRVCAALNRQKQITNKVTDNAVTTILLNPTATETLSGSRYLRLEIGTGPETLDYQTKVADYLWFSSSPKVNTIPRLMNG